MAKQNINVGTAANDKKGDSLRAAFQKVNANFTELYTELGLVNDVTLSLGAFEFAGSTISTTDSTAIVIDQATTITSNLSVGGDILPQTANGGDLGSSTLPWRSLYVSNNTIYIGGTAVGLDANGNLTVNGGQVNAPSSTLVNGAYIVSLGSNGNLEAPGIVSAAGLRTSETKIALGSNAGQTSQGSGSVAVGAFAGQTSQGPLSVAIGYGAGATTQGTSSVAVGNLAGSTTQGGLSVAVGNSAGQVNQGYEAVAVGFTTGLQDQGTWSVAIGSYAGAFSQGEDAIAIGRFAGQTNQPDNTIILNASGSAVDGVAAQTNSFYVAPIRNIGGTSGVLQYNAATKEVSYSSDITSEGNINIEVNLSDSTKHIWQFGEDGNLETPGGIQVAGILKIDNGVHEKFQTKADATGIVTHDCSLGHIFYHTSPDALFTVNFTNLNLSSGYATALTLIIEQGGTGFIPNSVGIGGVIQTLNWQGNVTPTPSTNRTDVVTFSIINNSGTYIVLGQLTGF